MMPSLRTSNLTAGLFALVAACSSPALAGETFPWNGTVKLTTDKGQTLSWTVARVGGEVVITGTHPKWTVEHRARPDGTPLVTTRRAGKTSSKVVFSADGASYEHTDKDGKTVTTKVDVRGLWDSDSLDARLAGIAWTAGKKVKFSAIDTDSDDATVYPLVAEYLGLEKCAGIPCHHVRVSLDDMRRYFAPKWDFRYGTGEGAPYLQNDSDGNTFIAR